MGLALEVELLVYACNQVMNIIDPQKALVRSLEEFEMLSHVRGLCKLKMSFS